MMLLAIFSFLPSTDLWASKFFFSILLEITLLYSVTCTIIGCLYICFRFRYSCFITAPSKRYLFTFALRILLSETMFLDLTLLDSWYPFYRNSSWYWNDVKSFLFSSQWWILLKKILLISSALFGVLLFAWCPEGVDILVCLLILRFFWERNWNAGNTVILSFDITL